MGAYFEVYEDEAGSWRWRLVASNGEQVATGESYPCKEEAAQRAQAVRTAARLAPVHGEAMV